MTIDPHDVASLRYRLATYRRTHPPGSVPSTPRPGDRRAAVLVPLVRGPAGFELLFTVRSRALRTHPGQVAFPGGALEPGETPERAACREAHEEVGLSVPPSSLVGRLPTLRSPARFVATPVVAVLDAPATLHLDPDEVDEAFTVAVDDLALVEPRVSWFVDGEVRRRLFHYHWGDREIWGFTGQLVHDVLSCWGAARAVMTEPSR